MFLPQENTKNKPLLLYHGSKNGIIGDINPLSRELCDFGKGFYMGTDKQQALTLICNFPNPKLYTLRADLDDLRILELKVGIDWALLIAYYRGKMKAVKNSNLYRKYSNMAVDCDIIIGHIANDRMFMVLDRFFAGDITDTALIGSLAALKLGKQYVAVTKKACRQIEVIDEKTFSSAERNCLRTASEAYRQEGIRKAEEVIRKHRRDGRFFDEILEEGY